MSAIGEMLQIASGTLPIWRDAVIAVLASFVIGCLYFYAETWGE